MTVKDPLAQHYSLSWPHGYISTTQGLMKAIWGDNFLANAGGPTTKNVSVKLHSRYRVIGGSERLVQPHSFTLKRYPHKLFGGPAGGQTIKIRVGNEWFTARLGGSVEAFKAWLLGAGKPLQEFQFMTQHGSTYSSAAKL